MAMKNANLRNSLSPYHHLPLLLLLLLLTTPTKSQIFPQNHTNPHHETDDDYHTLLHNTTPETQATLAFHVRVNTPSHLTNLPSFLHSIYHASNLYLVEISRELLSVRLGDLRDVKEFVRSKSNVWVRKEDSFVTKDGISEVLVMMSGMSFFLDMEEGVNVDGDVDEGGGGGGGGVRKKKRGLFDYFVNVVPDEVVLVGGEDMRKLFGYVRGKMEKGVFMEFDHRDEWRSRESLEDVDGLFYDAGIVFSEEGHKGGLIRSGVWHPDRGKRRWVVPKGDEGFVVSREFVRLVAEGMLGKRLLLALGESGHAVQHYFHAVAFNDEEFRSQILLGNLRCNGDVDEVKDMDLVESFVDQGCLFVSSIDEGSVEGVRRSARLLLETNSTKGLKSQFEKIRSLVEPLLDSQL